MGKVLSRSMFYGGRMYRRGDPVPEGATAPKSAKDAEEMKSAVKLTAKAKAEKKKAD